MTVAATIVATFGAESSAGFCVVELDDILNVDSAGEAKSSFLPGDSVYFWVQHDSTLMIDRVAATHPDATIVDCGRVSRRKTQELLFVSEEAIELSHIPTGMPTLSWCGRVGTGVQRDGRKLSVAGNTPCVCDAAYSCEVRLFCLVPPPGLAVAPGETLRIHVVIYLSDAA